MELADAVQWLVDRARITDVVSRYSVALDARDWDTWLSLFSDDVEFVLPFATLQGKEAVRTQLLPRTSSSVHPQHLDTNVLVTVEGDRAKATSYLYNSRFKDGTFSPERAVCTYDLVRTADEWVVTRVHIEALPTAQYGDPLPG